MTAREFADALARELGGAVRELPEDGRQFAVVTADGRAPVMVRQYLTGPLNACVPGVLAHAGAEAEFDAARLATFRAAALAWLIEHPEALSMYGVALALLDALAAELDEQRTVRISSPADPTELWLCVESSGHIGVFPDRVTLGRTFQVTTRRQLDQALPEILAAARRSRADAARHRASSATLETAARQVVATLAAATSLPTKLWHSNERASPSLLVFAITCDRRPVVVKLDEDTGELRVHAGIVGQGDVEVPLAELDARMPEVVAALARARATLTVGDLRVNARYRVLAKVGELSAGEEVTYKGHDDIDNHYGEYLFERIDGKQLVVGGDCSRPEHGPLRRAHEHLAVIE